MRSISFHSAHETDQRQLALTLDQTSLFCSAFYSEHLPSFLTSTTGEKYGELDSLMTPIFICHQCLFSDLLECCKVLGRLASNRLICFQDNVVFNKVCCSWCLCKHSEELLCTVHKLCSLCFSKNRGRSNVLE